MAWRGEIIRPTQVPMADTRHPGITMHKIAFGGGFMGVLFAGGSALIFVLGFPTLWYFVALAFALGAVIALLLKIASRYRSERNRPLSILKVPAQKHSLVFRRDIKLPRHFHLEQEAKA